VSKRRVVVTGLGLICPVGGNVADAWAAILRGESGIAPITRFDVSAAWTRAIESAGLGLRTPIYWDKCNHTIGDCIGDFGGQVEIFLFAHRGDHRLRSHNHAG